MRTALSSSDRMIYEKKKEYVIENFSSIGIEQKQFIALVHEAGYKLATSDLSKMLNGKQKLTLRWLPILDMAEKLINEEFKKVEALKNKS